MSYIFNFYLRIVRITENQTQKQIKKEKKIPVVINKNFKFWDGDVIRNH